ncbi:MAG TPA: histidine phosphatase family protein [Usitatibacter sp.]|nr:histidine phosphatase family protein [Usitatibacter sp.]
MISRRGFMLGALALSAAVPSRADDPPWNRLRRGGLVLLLRHAETGPGLGDPPGFRLDDCATQRNLSEAGRQHAHRIGERLRAEHVPVGAVFTSPWCRCRETARLAFGQAEDWEPLSSFFDFPHREAEFTERVKKRIGGYASRKPRGNVVMVTHNVNIAALTRHSVATGELVVVRPDGCCDARPAERFVL